MKTPKIAALLSHPREFLENKYVYVVISQRMGGLSVGINMNPDKMCNYNCVYCEVDRRTPGTNGARIDLEVMEEELRDMLMRVQLNKLSQNPLFADAPAELMDLKSVALSGNGEPTLCPNFSEVVKKVQEVQEDPLLIPFNIVVISNGSGFPRPEVQKSIGLLNEKDQVWAKLDAGTQSQFERINRTSTTLNVVMENILSVARQRPVIIQSLFLQYLHEIPTHEEVHEYIQRLKYLMENGGKISLVQIYSARRPTIDTGCDHLSLRQLMDIARQVRQETGLRVEVF